MAWSSVFTKSADPKTFDSNYNQDDWKNKNGSTTSVPSLDSLINKVVDRINAEGKNIKSDYAVTLAQLRSSIAGNYSSMTYQQKFQAIVDAGRGSLEKLRNSSVDSADFKSFYQRYYFYTPTTSQLTSIKDYFLDQDYGFGVAAISTEKTAALNRAINNGLLDKTTTVKQFEDITSTSNQQTLISRLLLINGSGDNAVIDPEIIKKNPVLSADALMRLKENNKLVVSKSGEYQWSKGSDWKSLKDFGNGALFNTYQQLVTGYETSNAKSKGQTLSQYIAEKNKSTFDQLVKDVASRKMTLNTSNANLKDAKSIIESSMKTELDKAVKSISADAADDQQKIAALRADVYKQVSAKLIAEQSSEQFRKSSELFTQTNSLFQDMASNLGVKSDFLTKGLLQSNIEVNWQNWFEKELRDRYTPNSKGSVVGRLVGTSEEDARLAANFVQNFLQRRFDASKSLSEFKEYVNPSSDNAVLETSQQKAWQNFASTAFSQVAGDINNPATALGNFWTNLQTLWSKGRQFDSSYYLSQTISGTGTKSITVEDLHKNLKLMQDVAVKKESINLTANDLKSLQLKGVNAASITELTKQAALFKQWFETAYANGVDLTDSTAFAKLHYTTYVKDSKNSLLQLESGKTLNINDTDLLSNTEAQMLKRQAELLVVKASDYATDIQFGKFKTPEEFVAELMKNSPAYEMSKDGKWEGANLTEIMQEFVSEYTGIVSSYAGEAVRKQIQDAIKQNQMPDQSKLGVDYIERTKQQALSTIRNLINQDAYQKAVVVDNAPGPGLGETLKDWFSVLGLELIPGSAWDTFKKENNISAETTYTQWAKNKGSEIDTSKNKTKDQLFWERWAESNGVKVISTGDSKDPRVTVVVEKPTSAWLSWGKRIAIDAEKNDVYIKEKLNGAKVSVRSDQFNADWYSKTNPYTRVVDEWNSIVARPNQGIINTQGKSLSQWAKDSGLSPEAAWEDYRSEMQKENSKFGQDGNGNDLSYITWSQKAGVSEINKFWSNSSSFWYQYLKDLGVIKGGTEKDPKFKTWSEWSIENKIDLKRADLATKKAPPDAFMQLHYSAMGGKAKVDSEYLKTYFPEFEKLSSSSGLLKGTALAESVFNLSDFGFGNDPASGFSMQPVTSSNRKSVSPIDYAMKQMFGDSMSDDTGDVFSATDDFMAEVKSSSLDTKLDTSYNKSSSAKKKSVLSDFGFGDFGSTGFGF